MTSSNIFSRVPVIDVHQDNLEEVWPALVLAIKSATFIGMDLELSGLGNRRSLNAKAIDDRYKAMADVSRTRSVLSLGLSCFKLTEVKKHDVTVDEATTQSKNDWKFLVQTFNILVLCTEDFMVEPITLKFLVDHGFDFNKQYAKGISYYRGNDQDSDTDTRSLRQLFRLLVVSGSPVVLHNALVDLVFLYHSFYAVLPPEVSTFAADLTQVFAGGVFDTKYVTEYTERLPASYLEYVFRRCQRSNSFPVLHINDVVSVDFLDYPSTYTYVRYCQCDLPCDMVERGDDADPVRLNHILCRQYASFGWCNNGSSCLKSHDIDDIIDLDGLKPANKNRKRKRRRNRNKSESGHDTDKTEDADSSLETEENGDDDTVPAKLLRVASPDHENASVALTTKTLSESNVLTSKHASRMSRGDKVSNTNELGIARKEGHRAGYDAFMTGYVMACYVTKYGKLPEEKRRNLKLSDLNVDEFKNKVYLCGKDIPMVISKSAFTKTSKHHREKLKNITGS